MKQIVLVLALAALVVGFGVWLGRAVAADSAPPVKLDGCVRMLIGIESLSTPTHVVIVPALKCPRSEA